MFQSPLPVISAQATTSKLAMIIYIVNAFTNEPIATLECKASDTVASLHSTLQRRGVNDGCGRLLLGNRPLRLFETLQASGINPGCVILFVCTHDTVVITASVEVENETKIWRSASGDCVQTISDCRGSRVVSTSFSPDGSSMVIASADGFAKIWNIAGECVQVLQASGDPVMFAAFSPDGDSVVTVSVDDVTRVFARSAGKLIRTFGVHSGVGDGDNCLVLHGSSSAVAPAVSSVRGKTVATISSWTDTKIWDTDSGECLVTTRRHGGHVVAPSFSFDGAFVVASCRRCDLGIWNTSSGECFRTLRCHDTCPYTICPYLTSVALSWSGAFVVSAVGEKALLWNCSTGDCVQTLEGHRAEIHSIRVSPSDDLMATASADKTCKVWSSSSGECFWTLASTCELVDAAFSSCGNFLVTVSEHSTANIYFTFSGECHRVLSPATCIGMPSGWRP